MRTDADGADLANSGDAFTLYDLHLSDASPCIDNASRAYSPSTDIEGKYRYASSAIPYIDRGAYEHGDGSDPICGTPVFNNKNKHFYWHCSEEANFADSQTYCDSMALERRSV